MDATAHYYVKYPTRAAAETALDSMGVQSTREPYQEGVRELSDPDTGASMFATVVESEPTHVQVFTIAPWLDEIIINHASVNGEVDDEVYEHAVGVLVDLEHLRSIPALENAFIFYGSEDHHLYGRDFVEMDEAFISKLWNLTRSRS